MRREQRELDRQVERERLELEKQVQQEKIRQMQQETELLKTETNLLKGETESLKSGRAPSQQEQELEVAASLLELQKRYPDLADYLPRMSQATEFFQMQGAISMEDYLEGLYAISKYSSFMSRDKSKIKIPTELPESQPDKKHRAQEDKDEAPPHQIPKFRGQATKSLNRVRCLEQRSSGAGPHGCISRTRAMESPPMLPPVPDRIRLTGETDQTRLFALVFSRLSGDTFHTIRKLSSTLPSRPPDDSLCGLPKRKSARYYHMNGIDRSCRIS